MIAAATTLPHHLWRSVTTSGCGPAAEELNFNLEKNAVSKSAMQSLRDSRQRGANLFAQYVFRLSLSFLMTYQLFCRYSEKR